MTHFDCFCRFWELVHSNYSEAELDCLYVWANMLEESPADWYSEWAGA